MQSSLTNPLSGGSAEIATAPSRKRAAVSGIFFAMIGQGMTSCSNRICDRVAELDMARGEQLREDGSVRISGLKHKLLSDYVVTSRTNVTHWMNCFRRQGFLQCSRDYLQLYPDALQRWLDSSCSESNHTNLHKMNPPLKGIAADPRPLTSREREVVGLAAQGRNNREIAQWLSISVIEMSPSGAPRYRAGINFEDADGAAVDAFSARHKL